MLRLLFGVLCDLFRSSASLEAEIISLRQGGMRILMHQRQSWQASLHRGHQQDCVHRVFRTTAHDLADGAMRIAGLRL